MRKPRGTASNNSDQQVSPDDKVIEAPSVEEESPVPLVGRERRKALMRAIENKRAGRLLIAYVTSTRPGFEVQIADDVLPMIRQCLEAAKDRASIGVDLFIHSNGGSGTAPWRIVNLIREYTTSFNVLVPHHAFSAATLIALGADSIVMHRMGFLGPIDPSTNGPFNPPHPQSAGNVMPISVEDVSAYFTMVKEDIGVQHEDQLIQAVIALTEKIHPLALGNVHRSHQQSRMLARKLLRKHMTEEEREHEIDKLVENLKSNLYYHGHPINRTEAKSDLRLKVENADEQLESLMWSLYEEYAKELLLNDRFNPLHEWDVRQPSPTSAPAVPVSTQDILVQIQQMAALGVGIGAPGISEKQLVDLAVAMIPHVAGRAASESKKVRLEGIKGIFLESTEFAQVFKTDLTVERDKVQTPQGPQDGHKLETLWQRWEAAV